MLIINKVFNNTNFNETKMLLLIIYTLFIIGLNMNTNHYYIFPYVPYLKNEHISHRIHNKVGVCRLVGFCTITFVQVNQSF